MSDRKRLTDEEILAQIPAARAAGREAERTEPRACSARYDAGTGRVVVELTNGCVFAFPAELGQGLRGASAEDLADVRVYARGEALRWERLDVDLSVPGIMAGTFGGKTWMRELGRAGGKVTSPAKAAAARANGRKGGRPRKRRATS